MDRKNRNTQHCRRLAEPTRRCKHKTSREVVAAFLIILTAIVLPSTTYAFQVPVPVSSRRENIVLWAASLDEVTLNLERAKALLEKSKRKLAAKENGTSNGGASMLVDASVHSGTQTAQSIPFFASLEIPQSTQNKRQRVIKTVNEQTGLITTDGEKMAQLSEEEEWEVRGLLEVFDNEIEDKDAYSVTSKQLASRDVAASIWNLRKTLQTQDYERIFDKSNRFIGENN